MLQNLEGVLETIRINCLRHPPLTPPIKGGERIEIVIGVPKIGLLPPFTVMYRQDYIRKIGVRGFVSGSNDSLANEKIRR